MTLSLSGDIDTYDMRIIEGMVINMRKKPDRYVYPTIFSYDGDGVAVTFPLQGVTH